MRKLKDLMRRIRLSSGDHHGSHLYGWRRPVWIELPRGELERPVRWVRVSIGPWWLAIGLEEADQ